jgi:GWxTD domain-containing protein
MNRRMMAGRVAGLFLLMRFWSFLGSGPQAFDPWKSWIEEVRPIMTRSEQAVFQSLRTEEDKKKFQQLFWKVRDPNPATPANEFQMEYFRRRLYARKYLGSADSDRGRVYLLLGKPTEKYDFSGSEKVVDCELWVYQGTGLPGLPPLMDLIFFRPNGLGDFKLYYPGMNTPLDILSTSYAPRSVSPAQARRIIGSSFPELGRAALSVIPDEAEAGIASLDSGATISQIFTLPERAVDRDYLKDFGSARGDVRVTVSTQEIAGKAALALSSDRGFRFLNWALLPDAVHAVTGADHIDRARIVLGLRVENLDGKTIHQQERPLDLKFDAAQKKALLEGRRLAFRDFAPMIEGEFIVHLTFMNRSTDEFFTIRERLSVTPETVPLMVGYKVKETGSDRFLPFRGGAFKVSLDPRNVFTPGDSVEGLVFTEERPELLLRPLDGPLPAILVENLERGENFYLFRHELSGVKPGNYNLQVFIGGRERASRILSIISFPAEKPLDFERSEPADSSSSYSFIVAQEYLNQGDLNKALEGFQKLPAAMWNSTTLPVIARAYYLKKDYQRVIEILEKDTVEKTYTVLLMLGNSCLETKNLRRAAGYFERVRGYGDTVENNRILGAIYISLGEREKAQTYWDRAAALEKRALKKVPNEKTPGGR